MSNMIRKQQTGELSGPGTGVSGGQFATHTGSIGNVDADLEHSPDGLPSSDGGDVPPQLRELFAEIAAHTSRLEPYDLVVSLPRSGATGPVRVTEVTNFRKHGVTAEQQQHLDEMAARVGDTMQAWVQVLQDVEDPGWDDGDRHHVWLDPDMVGVIDGSTPAQVRMRREADRLRDRRHTLMGYVQPDATDTIRDVLRLAAQETRQRALLWNANVDVLVFAADTAGRIAADDVNVSGSSRMRVDRALDATGKPLAGDVASWGDLQAAAAEMKIGARGVKSDVVWDGAEGPRHLVRISDLD